MSDDKHPPLTHINANHSTQYLQRSQPQEVLEHVKWNLAVLDEELAPHLKRRHELLQQIATLEELVHPMRRLSNEIHQEIFFLCLPDEHFPTLTPSEAPLLLTQVCSEWRHLALATPQLWAKIHLPVSAHDYELEGGAISLVHSWSEAARHAPMDVSLWSADKNLTDKSPITTCIASHSFHIRTLDLTGSAGLIAHFQSFGIALGDSTVDPLETGLSGTKAPSRTLWPILEKLTIRIRSRTTASGAVSLNTSGSSVSDKEVSKALFWSAPRLKRIILCSVDQHIFSLSLNWKQLEQVTVTGSKYQGEIDPSSFTHGEAKSLLQKCPKLSKLRITLSGHHVARGATASPPDTAPKALAHDHLTDLHLEDIFDGPELQEATFLHNLQLPGLKTLTYFLAPPAHRSHMAPLLPTTLDYPLYRFLGSQTSPVGLTSLVISWCSTTIAALFECLKLVPLLEKLCLSHAGPGLVLDPDACDVSFLDMLLPLEMRSRVVEDRTSVRGGRPVRVQRAWPSHSPPLDLPKEGLCPLLHYLNVQLARFTPEDILRFVNCRITLSQERPTRYSRMQRFYAVFMGEYRPDFVARDARGATSPIEEMLWDLGVDGALILRMRRGCYGKKPFHVQSGWEAGMPFTPSPFPCEPSYYNFGSGPFV